MPVFRYVGPPELAAASWSSTTGAAIHTYDDLLAFLQTADDGWATYVVVDGVMRLADRRSEHVDCAQGKPVQAAGELQFDDDGAVLFVSNQSTGYCPDVVCFDVVQSVLLAIGVAAPSTWTYPAVFRRCERCGERNLVKDGWFVCAVCENELPRVFNFA